MALAAFKSTSRRATSSAPSNKETSTKRNHGRTSPTKKAVPPRRSRSVSAVSRSNLADTSTTTAPAQATTSEFLIKRDNPLYWSNDSPPDREVSQVVAEKEQFKSTPTTPNVVDEGSRGRSVPRKPDVGRNGSGIGSSLSWAPVSRARSVSRPPVSRDHFMNSESDVEQEGSSLMRSRNGSDLSDISNARSSDVVRRSYDGRKSLRMGSLESAVGLASLPNRCGEDGEPGSSFSEAEERTNKAVCEQMKFFEGDNLGDGTSSRIYETVRCEVRRAIADIQNDLENTIRRSNATSIAMANVTDIPPDLVNPSAVELVLDIRREYSDKLVESQERARKLRADLAVEEHRGLELSRILKEVLPDPKTSNIQKTRPGRKSSIERRKVSKRLTEEAMAYFDECVSLSTFDSSDFSSQEDPPINSMGGAAPVIDHASFSTGVAANNYPNSFPFDKQELAKTCNRSASVLSNTGGNTEPALQLASLNSSETPPGQRIQFSFASQPDDTLELQQDIRKYVKTFEKDMEKADIKLQTRSANHFDVDEHNLQASRQNLLFDLVLFKDRIQSGGMLLCDGGLAVSFSPFASAI